MKEQVNCIKIVIRENRLYQVFNLLNKFKLLIIKIQYYG
jgi:hypothetical protein